MASTRTLQTDVIFLCLLLLFFPCCYVIFDHFCTVQRLSGLSASLHHPGTSTNGNNARQTPPNHTFILDSTRLLTRSADLPVLCCVGDVYPDRSLSYFWHLLAVVLHQRATASASSTQVCLSRPLTKNKTHAFYICLSLHLSSFSVESSSCLSVIYCLCSFIELETCLCRQHMKDLRRLPVSAAGKL